MTRTRLPAAAALFAWALWAGQPAMGQDPVDGVCDESVRNGCSAGTPNAAAYPDEPVVYQWRCDGLNGGRNSGRCALWFSVVGVCDESVRNGCAAGNPNDDAFPDSPTMYAWRCDGMNAGANSGRCHIRVADVVDGVCDDTVRNGCSAGTANDDAIPDNASTYLWRCDGLRGGTNSDKCHIRVADVVDGACDDTVRNGCSAGTANDAAIPDNATAYLWRCDGQRGGRNSDKCHIRMADVVDGACDDTVRNGCSAGTVNDDAIPDNATTYLWRCDGQRGGRNSDKCHIRVADVVDGVCDDTVRNGCSAGAANDDAIPDNQHTYLWRCDGLRGGADSEKCFIRVADVPVDGVCDDTVRNGCSAGAANDDAIPDNQHTYLWRCDGLRGGADSEKCFIRVADVPVDGVCDDTVRNGCSAGTANDDAFADNSTGYLWRCDGQHGGRNSDKCFIRVQDVPVDGVCDESVRDGCSAGTANDIAVADTTSHYRWRCDGIHGGANSGTCTRAKPPVAQVSCGGAWSPSPSTACSGQSFTQTRTCNVGCNDGDCATSRSSTGTKTTDPCCPARASCGGTWSPSPSTVCSGTSFTQTRTCNRCCNDGDCATSRQNAGTKPCPCPATTVSWAKAGVTCSGSVPETSAGTSVTPSNSTSCRSGSATFACHGPNWGSPTSASCTASPPVNGACSATGCSVGQRHNLSGGRWQCRGSCGGTTAGPVNGVCSATGCSAGERSNLSDGGWRCEGSCGGTTTSRCPVSCPATTLSWGSGCSGPVSQTPAGSSATPQNNIDCRSGSATFPCNYDRTWGDPTNASCTALPPVNGACSATGCSAGERDDLAGGGWRCEGSCGGTTTSRCPVSCPAATLSWGSGCSGPVSQTPAGSSATPQNNIDCRSGSATFPCDYDRTWGDPTNASCTALPPVNGACSATGCSTGEKRTLSSGGWQCVGSCRGTTEGPVNGVWRTGNWGGWGTCQFQTSSRRCEQSRSRTVTCDPPSCGGAACAPASKPAATATQACQNEQTCPSECRNGVRWDPVLRRYVRCS